MIPAPGANVSITQNEIKRGVLVSKKARATRRKYKTLYYIATYLKIKKCYRPLKMAKYPCVIEIWKVDSLGTFCAVLVWDFHRVYSLFCLVR